MEFHEGLEMRVKGNVVIALVLTFFLLVSFTFAVSGHRATERWEGTIEVVNAPPTLSLGSISLENGLVGTTFIYHVTYTDADDDAPAYVKVYIDGVGYSMDPVGGTYVGGFIYEYQTDNLGAGDHTYYFTASDGIGSARLPPSGTYSGPTVELHPTSLAVSPPELTVGYGENRTLVAALTSDGTPLAGKTITWETTVGSVNPSSSTTDSSGQATTTFTAPSIPASGTVTASFAGDSRYSSTDGSSSVTVQFTVTFTFTKPDGTPLAHTEIYYGLVEGGEDIYLGTTGSLGKITSTDSSLAGKTLYFRSADGRYTGSASVLSTGGAASVPTTGVAEFPWVLTIVAVIVLAAIVLGVITWKKMRSKTKLLGAG